MSGGAAEREADTESEVGSRISMEPHMRLNLMTLGS